MSKVVTSVPSLAAVASKIRLLTGPIRYNTAQEFIEQCEIEAQNGTRYETNMNLGTTGKRASSVLITQVRKPSDTETPSGGKITPSEDPFWTVSDLERQSGLHAMFRALAMCRAFVPTMHTVNLLKEMNERSGIRDHLPIIAATGARFHWASGTNRQGTQMAHHLPCSILLNGQGLETYWPLLSMPAEIIRGCYGSGSVLPAAVNEFDSQMETNLRDSPGLRQIFADAQRALAESIYRDRNSYEILLPVLWSKLQQQHVELQEHRIARTKDKYAATLDSEKRKKYERMIIVGECGLAVLKDIKMEIPPQELAVLNASFEGGEETFPRTQGTDDNQPSKP